jgi:hypothetical protein
VDLLSVRISGIEIDLAGGAVYGRLLPITTMVC